MAEITVLCSVYNGEACVGRMIDSVLASTLDDFELLIVDDCSDDNTGAIIASYSDPRIRGLRNDRNRGLTWSLNFGLTRTEASYIARLDADDVCTSDRLKTHFNFLKDDPDLFLVAGRSVEVIEGAGVSTSPFYGHDQILENLRFTNLFVHSAVTFRREPFMKMGGYDNRYKCSQDYDAWVRAVYLQRYKVKMCDHIAVTRHVGSASVSANRFFEQSINSFAIRTPYLGVIANAKLFLYQVTTSFLSFKTPYILKLLRRLKVALFSWSN